MVFLGAPIANVCDDLSQKGRNINGFFGPPILFNRSKIIQTKSLKSPDNRVGKIVSISVFWFLLPRARLKIIEVARSCNRKGGGDGDGTPSVSTLVVDTLLTLN